MQRAVAYSPGSDHYNRGGGCSCGATTASRVSVACGAAASRASTATNPLDRDTFVAFYPSLNELQRVGGGLFLCDSIRLGLRNDNLERGIGGRLFCSRHLRLVGPRRMATRWPRRSRRSRWPRWPRPFRHEVWTKTTPRVYAARCGSIVLPLCVFQRIVDEGGSTR